jgi:hypothetical protein
MPRKPPAPSEPAGDFRRWKVRATAMLKRHGIPSGPWARERDLRQLYIRGATPEKAVEQVQVLYNNTRPAFEHLGGKKR